MICVVMLCFDAIYVMLRFPMLCYAMMALLAGWAGLLRWLAGWAGWAGWLAGWLAGGLAGWLRELDGLGWPEAIHLISWCVDFFKISR